MNRYDTTTSFVDLLFNVMLIVIFCFVMTLPLASPQQKKKEGADLKAEFLISCEWEGNSDVDLYVQDPLGGIVWFQNKEIDLMHLDFDNQGSQNNFVTLPNGQTITLDKAMELISLRGIIPGEYVVNLHFYRPRDKDNAKVLNGEPFELPVTVTVQKLNPSVRIVYTKKVLLEKGWQEMTVLRFTLNDKGEVTAISNEPKALRK